MDFEFIERVVRLVEEADIGELEIESEDGLRVVVKKQPEYIPAPAMMPPMITGTIPVSSASPQESVTAKPAPVDDSVDIIKSPMVGTFYRAPAPDAPPFVEVGDVIQTSTVVCILEAMKVMNEIKAGIAGSVMDILVENGQAIEFGQPLFQIKKK